LLEDDGNRHLAKISASGGDVQRVLAGRRNVTAFELGPSGKIAALAGTPDRPNEVFTLDEPLRPLGHHNDALVDQLQLGAVDEIRFSSRDGTEIHGFVVKPPDYRPGTKVPTLLSIHGGPVGQFANDFSYPWQLFAAHGYLVVGVNPRGSSGRGEAFSKAIFADWGNLDRDDVLAAIDYVVAQGLADPDRLGVGGWSYGGILTNYVIASDRRFKAAISGSSSSNMLATYGTDMYAREYEAELGPPWKNPDPWLKLSYPFLHADRITTPTLFLCGDKDFNVPLLNTEQMYQALRSLNVDTQLVIYPGEYHEIARPSYQRDRMQRNLDWYDKYLK
jgi:dipeptidyl aminopeptidase/acylaminoacyl peptidase